MVLHSWSSSEGRYSRKYIAKRHRMENGSRKYLAASHIVPSHIFRKYTVFYPSANQEKNFPRFNFKALFFAIKDS